MRTNLPRDLCAGAGPWGVDPDFSDESFSSIINFIRLVERVPKLAVAEASFLSLASSCGPPPPRPHSEGKQRRARPPVRSGAAVPRYSEGCRFYAPWGGVMNIFFVLRALLPPLLDVLFSASLDLDFYAGAGATTGG